MATIPADDGQHRYPFETHVHAPVLLIESGDSASLLVLIESGDSASLLDGYNRLVSQDPNIQRCATSKMENGRYRTCDAVYRCVDCSRYRLAERRRGLKAGLASAPDAAFVTLTRAHGAGALLFEWDITEEILNRLTNRSDWSKFKNLHGIDGYAVIEETPVSDTGWNVHVHLLITFDHMLDQQAVEAFTEALTARWCRAAAHVGYEALKTRQTVTMLPTQDDRDGAAAYVTKQNLLHLATDTKAGSYPADLLAGAFRGNIDDEDLYREYLEAAFGRTMIRSYGRLSMTPEPEIEKRESRPWSWDDILDSSLDPVVTEESSPSPRAPRENRNARDREHLHSLYEGVSSASTQYEVYLAMKAEEKRAYDSEQARLDFWRTHHRAPVVAYDGTLS